MSVLNQTKPLAFMSAAACALCLLWGASASAMDKDSMSHDQNTTGMQDDKAAEGHAQGMSHDNSMSHDDMSEKDGMSHDSMSNDDGMQGNKAKEGQSDSMSHDGMKKDSM